MSREMTVRVHYPMPEGRVLLRTDEDWDVDVEPLRVDPERSRFDFRFELGETHRYFKPVLRNGAEVIWSQGDDFLAVANGDATMDVYPHFLGDTHCSVCTVRSRTSRDGSRTHPLRIFLPPGYYENTLQTYPVLYMQDGQNLFFGEEAFAGQHWQVQDTMTVLDSMSLVRKAIVVGIHPRDRLVDYTRDGYEAYGRFLVEDLKPWVDASYRTRPAAADTAVMGSSLGGVVSLYLAWQWPDVFGNVACMSSTFGYRDDLEERIRSEPRRNLRIYLDSGWPADNYEATRSLRNTLVRRGYRLGRDLLYLAFPKARHDEAAWAMRAHIPFQLLFGR
jgi:enterochelin esterase-like enzyme